MSGGNAKDFSYGDMLRNQAEIDSVNEPEWIVDQTTFMKPAELERSKEMLQKQAAKNGKVIGIKETKGGFIVTVEHRNPKYKPKGGKKK